MSLHGFLKRTVAQTIFIFLQSVSSRRGNTMWVCRTAAPNMPDWLKKRDGFIWFNWLFWSVSFISLNQTKRTNPTDQTDPLTVF